ncbi:hypothetical protein [Flavobacterium sp.]|uniref:hypothetical protein n=1 Tax=Flavobacterium sp. TaxID=239 RepID=UPI0025B9953B|nr:hypothetical protein [Flavobacterium sp.]
MDDNGKPDIVRRDGPFKCTWDNSWLGHGYYFWETFLQNAHWWGKARLNGNYMIAQATCVLNDEKIFDLVGNTQHLLDLERYIHEIRKGAFIKTTETTMSQVFHFIKNQIKEFKYEATRAYGIDSISMSMHSDHIYRMFFEEKLKAYIDLKPAIQICLYAKNACSFSNWELIYPETYLDEGYF